MSKAKLRKKLQTLQREHLEQIILDAYDAKKEIKEYFEFFLNPDVDKLYERYSIAVSKELSRSKYHLSKARTTVLKRLIKDFDSHHPGFDYEINLRIYVVNYALLAELYANFNETQINAIASIMKSAIEIADKNYIADTTLNRIITTLDNPESGSIGFRSFLRKHLSLITSP